MPEFPDWDSPAGHASAIAATGVPLLHLKRVVANPSPITVGGGSTVIEPSVLGFYNFTGISYEIFLQISTAAATATRLGVQLIWSDSVSTQVIAERNFSMYAGTTAAPHFVVGRGPTSGDQLQVNLNAPDNTVTVTMLFTQRSTPYVGDLWRTTFGLSVPSFPGFTSSIVDPAGGYLASVSSSVALSNFTATLLPLYTGVVTVAGTTTDTTAGNSELRISAPSEVFATPASNLLYRLFNGQEDSAHVGVIRGTGLPLPNVQCELFQVNNNASAAETIAGNVIAHQLAAA